MLAIIIPYYKLIFFEDTLLSLANQTDKRFKVYIGDDASDNKPDKLIEKYQGKFDFTYNRFETNLGKISLVKHWERCIDLIEDEQWIMILGDDDSLGENVIELFYKHLSVFNTKSNLVRFSSVVLKNDNLENINSKVFKHPTWENACESYCRKIRGRTRSSLSEYIFSKEVFFTKKFTDYPLAFFSDDKAWLDFSNDKPIYSINDASAYIGISNLSVSGKIDNLSEKVEAEIKFISEIYYHRLYKFDKACRLDIIRKFEIAILKKRKLNVLQWLHLYGSYLKNYDKKLFIKFNKRLIKTVIYGKKVVF